MEFCPNCGTRLATKKAQAKKVALWLVCHKCGYEKPQQAGEEPVLVNRVIQHSAQQMVAVIGEQEAQLNTLPTIDIECPRCGNNRAYVWLVQTRGADESSTQFMRCSKCNFTFREYS
ncbi:MAG: transcription factor S [Candidatus Bathyarchaeia archaeon]